MLKRMFLSGNIVLLLSLKDVELKSFKLLKDGLPLIKAELTLGMM